MGIDSLLETASSGRSTAVFWHFHINFIFFFNVDETDSLSTEYVNLPLCLYSVTVVSSLHRSVCDWILLPSRTKGKSQNPCSDFGSAHGRRHRPLCWRFHPDWQEAWRHLLNRTNGLESGGFRKLLAIAGSRCLLLKIHEWCWLKFSYICRSLEVNVIMVLA